MIHNYFATEFIIEHDNIVLDLILNDDINIKDNGIVRSRIENQHT